MRRWLFCLPALLLTTLATCPPDVSYIEIEQGDLPYTTTDSTKYAVCDELFVSDGVGITVSGRNVVIDAAWEGGITYLDEGNTGVKGILVSPGSDSVVIRRMAFEWIGDGAQYSIQVQSDSTVVDSCFFYGKAPFFEPKITDADSTMTASGIKNSTIEIPAAADWSDMLSFGASNVPANGCFIVNNRITGTVSASDAVGISTTNWVSGLIADNWVDLTALQAGMNIMKQIQVRGTYIEDNTCYARGYKVDTWSVRDISDGQSDDESRNVTFRRNFLYSDGKGLNFTADSSLCIHNYVVAGVHETGNEANALRIANEVDSCRIESNIFFSYGGPGLRSENTDAAVYYINNTFVSALTHAAEFRNEESTGYFRNNIFAALRNGYALTTLGNSIASTFSMDYDLFYSKLRGSPIRVNGHDYATPTTLFAATGLGEHSLKGDPKFYRVAEDSTADWHLTALSPGRNLGLNGVAAGSQDYYGYARVIGGTIDMGADEFSPVKTPVPQSLSLAPRP